MSIVNDISTYCKLSRDPTTHVEKTVADHIRRLHRLGYIPDKLKDKLLPSYSNPPKMYGLPKVHKKDTPLRPIVSSIGSPTYRLAKELAQILSPLTGNTESFVKNSTEFVNSIRNLQIDDDDCLASFDVVSLFTSVPINEALDIVAQRLEEDDTLMERTPIPTKEIHMLAEVCLKSTYFQYGNQFYEQIEGAAMGSPLSPIIANLYMEHLEQKAL